MIRLRITARLLTLRLIEMPIRVGVMWYFDPDGVAVTASGGVSTFERKALKVK